MCSGLGVCVWGGGSVVAVFHLARVSEAPSMSVKRACDWSVTAPRRAVHVSEARMGLVNGRAAHPTRSRNSNPRCSEVSRLITWASCADINITQPASIVSVR